MNAQKRGGIFLVPGHHDQDDVAYFARLWNELSQPEPPTAALPPPVVASSAIRASSLTPGSLSALLGFSIGSKSYQPGDAIDCTDTPSLAEALVRFGYASRMPDISNLRIDAKVAPLPARSSTQSAKDRLKKALANLHAGGASPTGTKDEPPNHPEAGSATGNYGDWSGNYHRRKQL
jgi:hypothetical protein